MAAWSSSASQMRRRFTTTATCTRASRSRHMGIELPGPSPSWNIASDLSQLLEYHFMVNALLAGSLAAVTAGLLGWLMLVRRETFAGHTRSEERRVGKEWRVW